MGEQQVAIATLLYSTAYLPGVFTLGYQLRKLEKGSDVALLLVVSRNLYQEVLTELSLDILRTLFTEIIAVDPVEGVPGNEENLKLLKRPELEFTFLKARLWELNYDRVLYLDSDTLPLSNDVFRLFEDYPINQNQIAGAPDVGWPDMFNSGVLLLAPNKELAQSLQEFISDNVSMDGADQGILNQFFNAYCSRGIEKVEQRWIRLPFIYNVTMPNYGYQSSPATRFFKQQIKLVHFIGENKPWKGWSEEENGYTSEWNETFLKFQSEYDLAEHMKSLNLEPKSSAWKESMTQLHEQPERVFPDEPTQQPVLETPSGVTPPTHVTPSVPSVSSASSAPPVPSISSVPPVPSVPAGPGASALPPTNQKKDTSATAIASKRRESNTPKVERVFPEDSEDLQRQTFQYGLNSGTLNRQK